MRVVVVGQGRVGRGLAKRAKGGGDTWRVVSGGRLTRRALGDADLVILAVPDSAIASVARRVAPLLQRGACVLHCAGARSPEELSACRRAGAHVGAMHPLASFADPARPPLLQETTFVVAGDRKAVRAARRIASTVGARVLNAPIHGPAYHALAALVAGGSVGFAHAVIPGLVGLGVERRAAEACGRGVDWHRSPEHCPHRTARRAHRPRDPGRRRCRGRPSPRPRGGVVLRRCVLRRGRAAGARLRDCGRSRSRRCRKHAPRPRREARAPEELNPAFARPSAPLRLRARPAGVLGGRPDDRGRHAARSVEGGYRPACSPQGRRNASAPPDGESSARRRLPSAGCWSPPGFRSQAARDTPRRPSIRLRTRGERRSEWRAGRRGSRASSPSPPAGRAAPAIRDGCRLCPPPGTTLLPWPRCRPRRRRGRTPGCTRARLRSGPFVQVRDFLRRMESGEAAPLMRSLRSRGVDEGFFPGIGPCTLDVR